MFAHISTCLWVSSMSLCVFFMCMCSHFSLIDVSYVRKISKICHPLLRDDLGNKIRYASTIANILRFSYNTL